MRILIVGLNYAPEKVGIAVYTTGMAEALVGEGHEVRVVAAKPYYPAWRIADGHHGWSWSTRRENGVSVTRVPHYIPASPSGKKRVLHHMTFAASALIPALWNALVWRPNIVLTIAPSLIAAPVARLAALMVGAQSWLHVQDFEVEAAFATGLLNGKSYWAKMAIRFEAAVLKSFAKVSAISPEMCRHLVDKGVPRERVTEFRNWADIDTIRPMAEASLYRANWGITTPHVALYSGNIANKQGIGIVLDAARLLRHRQDLTFVICGEGPNRTQLEAAAGELGNIQFHDLQPKEHLPDLMGLATIHLLPQLAGAAGLVLPSKLANMLASGRPVVATAAPDTGLAREVEGCGVVVAPGDTAAFARGIESLLDDRQVWATAAANARTRAETRWAEEVALDEFMGEIERLVRRPVMEPAQVEPRPD